jgi:hypothetical protein
MSSRRSWLRRLGLLKIPMVLADLVIDETGGGPVRGNLAVAAGRDNPF